MIQQLLKFIGSIFVSILPFGFHWLQALELITELNAKGIFFCLRTWYQFRSSLEIRTRLRSSISPLIGWSCPLREPQKEEIVDCTFIFTDFKSFQFFFSNRNDGFRQNQYPTFFLSWRLITRQLFMEDLVGFLVGHVNIIQNLTINILSNGNSCEILNSLTVVITISEHNTTNAPDLYTIWMHPTDFALTSSVTQSSFRASTTRKSNPRTQGDDTNFTNDNYESVSKSDHERQPAGIESRVL